MRRKIPYKLIKPTLALAVLGLLAWFAPVEAFDSWHLLSPKKMSVMLFALTFIQVFGSVMAQFLGAKAGAILTGFFGGLVSSTATTAALARQSKVSTVNEASVVVMFLSATCAMLFEGVMLVVAGTKELHSTTLVIFIGPIVATVVMIYWQSQKLTARNKYKDEVEFKILPILKLAILIIAILFLSKLLQNVFGQYGLLILTFLVSLFEIHGSVISNVQLHESGGIDVELLGGLIALSIVASYLSKLFLIATLGSSQFRSQAIKATLILFIFLLLSWSIAINI